MAYQELLSPPSEYTNSNFSFFQQRNLLNAAGVEHFFSDVTELANKSNFGMIFSLSCRRPQDAADAIYELQVNETRINGDNSSKTTIRVGMSIKDSGNKITFFLRENETSVLFTEIEKVSTRRREEIFIRMLREIHQH